MNRMFRHGPSTLLVLLLAACASTNRPPAPAPSPPSPRPAPSADAQRQAEFDRSQQRWHGAPVKELVSKLGPPTLRAEQEDGHKVLVYVKTAKLSGPTGPIPFRCVVRYVLDNPGERVASHTIEGC
ncbi:hypothetical protein [Pelomonas sp. KK5]|uniref:hypothetical protein n=1 Tax=Pelomonas sp. KK5 TaxID=1855730 RepID=UPI00117CF7ED|nr:hypothetical protein [Pelomonas sp. KK5]